MAKATGHLPENIRVDKKNFEKVTINIYTSVVVEESASANLDRSLYFFEFVKYMTALTLPMPDQLDEQYVV